MSTYYAKNREKVLEYQKVYLQKNYEKVREAQKAYYNKKKEEEHKNKEPTPTQIKAELKKEMVEVIKKERELIQVYDEIKQKCEELNIKVPEIKDETLKSKIRNVKRLKRKPERHHEHTTPEMPQTIYFN